MSIHLLPPLAKPNTFRNSMSENNSPESRPVCPASVKQSGRTHPWGRTGNRMV